jgi:hypothetical protein
MAIGFAPIIPLDRVVPDPNARFQRFGVDETELFGKPLLTAGPNYQPSRPAWTVSSLAAAQAQPADHPAKAPKADAAPGPGKLVDLTV